MIDYTFASYLIEKALSEGAQEVEFFLRVVNNLTIEVKDQKVESIETSITKGYSFRVFKDSKLGFSYSTDLSEAEKVLREALEISKYTEKDEHNGLPSFEKPSVVEIYDRKIASISKEEAISKVLEMEGAAFNISDKIKKTRKASASFAFSDTFICNSQGIICDYSSTGCSSQIMAIAEDFGDSQIGWFFSGSRFLEEIDFANTGKEAALRALALLNSKKIASTKGFVLLDSAIAVDFLGLLSIALSAESVQKGKSMFANKIGEKVTSEKVNIIDNGILDRKLGSKPFDDEGVPMKNKVLIENGLLRSFLYNTYTAKKDKKSSTGNAIRGRFSNVPSVSPSNLYIESSKQNDVISFNNMLKIVDKGVYVLETMGMHTANPISGEFSVGISGLYIENGELKQPVKEAIISGNIIDLFKKIVVIGDDLRFYGNLGSPSLLIADIDISG
ncbi:MAG: TldD/PmbA family protein [Thermodesulfovibrionales bacterium]|nr:TldD/PmbA family protein [Thermodesulfovibrionales bacterium]